MNFLEKITLTENLAWAWQKVRNFYRADTTWFDDIEFARFELNLDTELKAISNDIKKVKYRLAPLIPIPFPKQPDKDGNSKIRQMFYVSIRDQVTWAAVLNILGPRLDSRMPEWSYGNRLYRSAWLEDIEGIRNLRIGPYRHSSGLTYRKFQHSWPLYKRYILLTLRQMSLVKYGPKYILTDAEETLRQIEEGKAIEHRHPYLRPTHWKKRHNKIYWVSLDFTKFYPNIDIGIVENNLIQYSGLTDEPSRNLLRRLLQFRFDPSGYSHEQLGAMGLLAGNKVHGLPTGLIASGFLANVAMISIDNAVDKMSPEYPVAHFRYVDDHVVLATSFTSLVKWVEYYRSLLNKAGIASLNLDKSEPREVSDFLSAKWSSKESDFDDESTDLPALEVAAKEKSLIDPNYPTPLMTTTLAKVSTLAMADFELMDTTEQAAFLADAEHLLLADLPVTELRPETRVSFAASLISRLAAKHRTSSKDIVEIMSSINRKTNEIHVLSNRRDVADDIVERQKTELEGLKVDLQNAIDVREDHSQTTKSRYFFLLIKALIEFPERLRIWQRVLDYSQNVGLGLKDIEEQFLIYFRSNSLAGHYLYAYILQHLARQVLTCTHVVLTSTCRTADELVCSNTYLAALESSSFLSLIPESPHFFVDRSRQAFRIAKLASNYLIEAHNTSLQQLENSISNGTINKRNVANLKTALRHVTSNSTDPVAAWLWWLERLINLGGKEPSLLWTSIGDMMKLSDEESWSAITTYPQSVPMPVIAQYCAGTRYLSEGEQGWLLDVLKVNNEARHFVDDVNMNNVIGVANTKRVIRVTRSEEYHHSLFEWAKWTAKAAANRPFDPRTGEWTAIQIARQVCAAIRSVAHRKRRLERFVQPHNIVVPMEWMSETPAQQTFDVLTWEEWKIQIVRSNLCFRKHYLIKDYRYFDSSADSDPGWEVLHSIGILLLGLLRRDFVWAAPLSSVRRDNSWASLVKSTVRSTKCSSWTRAIIDACLLPRFRETLLLDLLQPKSDYDRHDDTISEDLHIQSLDDLDLYLSYSSRVLSSGQITVRDHLPRQLVAISVEQLRASEWSEYADEDEVDD